MEFSKTYIVNSMACPGVSVTLRRLGPKPRAATELSVSGARARYRGLIQTADNLNASLQAGLDAVPGYRDAVAALPKDESGNVEIPPALLAMVPQDVWDIADQRSSANNEAAALVRSEIHPAFVLAAVQTITGITGVGDGSYTAEQLCEYGPDELFDEVISAINENVYLSKERAENLPLPTTSGAQGDGGQTSTNAATAK